MSNPHDMSTKSTAARLAAAQVKAEALTEALPWIKTFAGATIVIKYGGNAMISPELQQSFADDIAFLRFAGHPTRRRPRRRTPDHLDAGSLGY